MITDKTLDEALVELLRCKRALEALRSARKTSAENPPGSVGLDWRVYDQHTEHAAAKRASMDLTRKLAALRAGR
jgi:hypothetical protein